MKYYDKTGALTMSLTKNKLKAQYLKISLKHDLYVMTFSKVKNDEIVVIKTIESIFFDQLQKIFTKETGLDTSLGTMGK